ncbi:DUF6053 domain-containing protein [Lysobacter sp. CA199]
MEVASRCAHGRGRIADWAKSVGPEGPPTKDLGASLG